jgi:hypothetical protein
MSVALLIVAMAFGGVGSLLITTHPLIAIILLQGAGALAIVAADIG